MAIVSNPGPRLAVVAGAEAEDQSFTIRDYRQLPCQAVGDIFDFENLFPQLVLALGLALMVGNGLAWWKHRRGESPEGVEDAQFRAGRVAFLSVVGLMLSIWGAATLFT